MSGKNQEMAAYDENAWLSRARRLDQVKKAVLAIATLVLISAGAIGGLVMNAANLVMIAGTAGIVMVPTSFAWIIRRTGWLRPSSRYEDGRQARAIVLHAALVVVAIATMLLAGTQFGAFAAFWAFLLVAVTELLLARVMVGGPS